MLDQFEIPSAVLLHPGFLEVGGGAGAKPTPIVLCKASCHQNCYRPFLSPVLLQSLACSHAKQALPKLTQPIKCVHLGLERRI